jgi:hypothetical protein
VENNKLKYISGFLLLYSPNLRIKTLHHSIPHSNNYPETGG